MSSLYGVDIVSVKALLWVAQASTCDLRQMPKARPFSVHFGIAIYRRGDFDMEFRRVKARRND